MMLIASVVSPPRADVLYLGSSGPIVRRARDPGQESTGPTCGAIGPLHRGPYGPCRGLGCCALIHAQPPYLVYLSHIPAYREERVLNRLLLRWQPETLAQLPEGLAAPRGTTWWCEASTG
jgi:hypothetical protein